MDDILDEFLTETNDSLAKLESLITILEDNPKDIPAVREAFRILHTIKGTSGFLGLDRLQNITHTAETVLAQIRDGKLNLTGEIATEFLKTFDHLKSILQPEEIANPTTLDLDLRQIKALERFIHGEWVDIPEPEPEPQPENEEDVQGGTAEEAQNHEEIDPQQHLADQENPAKKTEDTQLPLVSKKTKAKNSGSIRTSVQTIDNLINSIGELVLVRNQLLQSSSDDNGPSLKNALSRLSSLTSTLQEEVMKTRMQPVETLFSKFPRVVRDLAVELNKKVNLVMEGGKTELDRQVLELMKDPITHMVRNAVDHGIETPDVRQKEGKPETGTVLLKAYHGGGQVVIEIKDDGRGLNTEKIKQKILDRELATVEELSTLSPWQILNYIFKPGFSTADVVSHISGRGIGMDVVKTNIEQLGGTIDVRSTFGKGSLFVIKIPLTLTIIPSIIVSVAGHHFAVPQVNVIELVRMGLLSIHSVEHINRVPMLRLREALLPLIYLDELLQLVPQKSQRTMEKNHCIIIIKIGNIHFGMVVDSVFDMQEIVVKPLSAILEVAPYFSGSTILGNGHVIMILDPNTIAANLAESNTLDFSMPFSHTKQDKDSDTVLHITFFSKNDSYAVPLGSVEHIIDLVPQALELRDGIYLCPYQGHAIRVFFPSDDREEINSILAQDSFPLLIFSQLGHTVGFAVHEITNVIEGPVHIDVENRQNGIMGTNFINEQMTSILDPEFFLKTAHPALFTEEDAFF